VLPSAKYRRALLGWGCLARRSGPATGTNVLMNRVTVGKALMLRNINGAHFTVIDGKDCLSVRVSFPQNAQL